ncbi:MULTISPECIES: CRISPR-associated helicase/endonuclease Cas3 [Thermodesulfovibrio]|uniref:CRISPR-associated helicase Cas3 n=1 Tax=Thermodesulfovibrio yellowstonii (strain ATCC 51303 / DSM 11347 / YP87) TaxID=289376 RepID=B5YIV2_THEYD|nr:MULTISPECIES: CRISPR-associated helicase/endonuclease Cas3 [Thermodesulfovibrio]ACI20256.1 CRISPR-associated helicase Cas3 [Thermodesulfovibrio yellowstonii DSM 11347]MDI6864471.1 CRISPR-associated helicase/endonuclease Cas3 [Thermodesulfovibrio yellowstonii]
MPVFAKSNPPETIEEHNKKIFENYERIKPFLDPEKIKKYDEVIKKIIYYHDLGKLNHKFQNKLGLSKKVIIPELKDIDEIPHEWLSLAFLSREDKRYFHTLSTDTIHFADLVQYCIAFHHTRTKPFDKKALEKTICHDLEKNKGLLGINHSLNFDYDIFKDIKQKIDSQKNFKNYFELLVFLKGILHKCDYTASANIEPESHYSGNYEKDFNNWLSKKGWHLKPFQNEAKRLSDKSVVLVASTGTGKTEYSMNWINGQKAFYLLGIRTAVNEMYRRFKDIFGENVSLLHGEISNIIEDDDTEERYVERIETARKLSTPLTVATADQLVTSVFKYNGFEMTYLTASYSKIVLDEIQSFSPDSIAAIMVFLKEVHRLGSKFLIMTATLPPFIKEELKELQNVEFPEPVLLPNKRHFITVYDEPIDSERSLKMIDKNFKSGKKILIVCNTVKKAQQMYDMLKNFNPSLLHSRYILKDRKNKESRDHGIMAVNNPKHPPVIWIATQVVEASLDLDFDALFTECSPIDSLLQRFGRCWRKREYTDNKPNIHIFKAEDNRIYDKELLDRTYSLIFNNYKNKIMDERDKQDAIFTIFKDIEKTKYYEKYKRNKELLELGFKAQSKTEAEAFFRNIAFNYCVIPRLVYEENEKEIRNLIELIDNKDTEKMQRIKAKAKIKDFIIPLQIFGNFKNLTPVPDSEYCKRNNIMIMNEVTYSYEKGLQLKDTAGEGVLID